MHGHSRNGAAARPLVRGQYGEGGSLWQGGPCEARELACGFLLLFSSACRELAAAWLVVSALLPCPLCRSSAILRRGAGQRSNPAPGAHALQAGGRWPRQAAACGTPGSSLHAGAGQGVEDGADGVLVRLERLGVVFHVDLYEGRVQGWSATRSGGAAEGDPARPAPRVRPGRRLTGLLVKRIRLAPRIDQRLMWCSGYLRSVRVPALLRMKNPSSPTSTITRSAGPSSGTQRTWKRSPGAILAGRPDSRGEL